MTYTIYSSQSEEVTKRLDRIARKAERYNVPFSYTIGEAYAKEVAVYEYDPANGALERVGCMGAYQTYTVEAVDIDINCEGFIKANGWTVLAKIEHGDKGNIVTPFADAEINPDWYTAPARCDHCGTNRTRTVTFMCRNENGDIRQVGKSCLKDYTGILPQVAVWWAEVTDIIANEMDCDSATFATKGAVMMYSVKDIIALACDSIKAKGYIKSDSNNATKDQVIKGIKENAEPSKDGIAKAEEIIDWLKELGDQIAEDEAELNRLYALAYDTTEDLHPVKDKAAEKEYIRKRDSASYLTGVERDCIPLAKSGYAKINHIGRLAYMPIAYARYIERKEREAKRIAEAEAARNSSEYVGEIGKRMEFNIAEMKLLSSWDTQYGVTYLYKFVTTDGNVLMWFASSIFGEWKRVGKHQQFFQITDCNQIKATIKSHNERDGVKQTIITRCKKVA